MDKYTEETVRDINEQRESKARNIVKAIDPKLLIAIAALILFGIYAVSVKPPIFTMRQMLWIDAIGIIIILIIAYKQMTRTAYLTYPQAYAIALSHLVERQRMLIDIPAGDIQPMGTGRCRKLNGEPYEWSFGFVIRDYSNYEHVYEIDVDAKVDGLGVIGVIPKQQSGYNPMEKKDLFYPQYNNEQFLPPSGGLGGGAPLK